MIRWMLCLVMAAPVAVVSACGKAAEPGATSPAAADQAEAPGIVDRVPDELPKNAQVVPLDDGRFMVPYEAETPGFGVTYRMTPVLGGVFTMGSPRDEFGREDDEGPQFQVEVEPFWVGVYAVTWAEYHVFAELAELARFLGPAEVDFDHADAVTLPSLLYYPKIHYSFGGDDDHPAVTMSQYAARQYTKFLSRLTDRFYRLPTEAEWEYAARAGTTTAWSFGDDIEDLPRYSRHFDPDRPADAEGALHVGALEPNPWGLYDMHGNVANLVLDEYIADHYARFADRDQPVHFTDVIAWPTARHPVVVRGGSWDHDPEGTRSAARWHTDEDWQVWDPDLPQSVVWYYDDIFAQTTGFRLIRPLNEMDAPEQRRFWASGRDNMPADIREDLEDQDNRWRLFRLRLDAETIQRIKQEWDGDEEP